jgi:hypothetical protein
VDKDTALPIVQDAFFADATRYGVVKDGVLDPKQLKRYIEVNKDTLSAVPEIKQALQNISGDGLELVATIAKLNKLKTIQDSQDSAKVFQRFSNAGVDGVAASFLTSPDFRKQFLSPGGAGNNKAAIDTLRAKMVQSVMDAPNPLEFLSQNREALDKLFVLRGQTGTGTQAYSKALSDLAEVGDKLNTKLFINTPLKTIQRTGLEEATGVSPAGLVSVIRDRVAGTTYKAINLLSRFYINQTDSATKEELGRFLSDPEAVRNVASSLKKLDALDLSGLNQRSNKLAKDLMGSIAQTLVRRGVIISDIGTQGAEGQPAPTPEFNPEDYELVQ